MITQAMVLAAGEGRRLRPLTDHTPKPLIRVGNKTMLDHALDALEKVGVTHCVVNTYHLGNQIETHLKNRTSPKILISPETELLDTGGGIVKALPHFKDQPFFVLNADIWWKDRNHSALEELEKMWDSKKMDALILLMPREKAIGFEGPGDYFLKENGQIYHRGQEATAPYIFSGIRILNPRLLEGEEVRPFSIMPRFHQAEKEGRLYGLVYDGEWGDIGTIKSLETIQNHLLATENVRHTHAQRNR